MKFFLIIFLLLGFCGTASAKKFEFTIHNSLQEPLKVTVSQSKNGKNKTEVVDLGTAQSLPFKVNLKADPDEVRFSATILNENLPSFLELNPAT